jgi:hypothetical protein
MDEDENDDVREKKVNDHLYVRKYILCFLKSFTSF